MIDSETRRRYSAADMTAALPPALLPSCRRHDGSNAAVMTAAKPASLPPTLRAE